MSAHHGFTYDFSIWYCPAADGVASSIAEHLRARGFQGYAEHQDRVAGTCAVQSAAEAVRASRVAILLLSAEALGGTRGAGACPSGACSTSSSAAAPG